MNFCEECGHSLSAGARFCESCGAGLSPIENSIHVRLDRDSCLMVFNGVAWRERWGLSESLYLKKQLQSYAVSRGAASRVHYEILDLEDAGLDATPSFEEVLGAIISNSSDNRPKYLFLIGGDEEMPMARYSDLTPHDQDIASDHGYSMLSNRDFGDGSGEVSMAAGIMVGRLPIASDSSPQDLQTYFNHALDPSLWPGERRKKIFAATCKVWEPASKETSRVLDAPLLLTSPALNHEQLNAYLGAQYDCLFFNVHGSSNNPSWWGQGLSLMPEVARPKNFLELPSVNITSSEACYGARFEGLPRDESVMMTSLFHRSLGFFGSTRIAYGPAEAPNWGADTLVREFLRPYCSSASWSRLGVPMGMAASRAKAALLEDFGTDRSDILPILLKTFLEFNLFGDPALFAGAFAPTAKVATSASMSASPSGISDRIDRAVNERSARLLGRIEAGISRLSGEIRKTIDSRIASLYPDYTGVQPVETSYRSSSRGEQFLLTYYQASDPRSGSGLLATCSPEGLIGSVFFMK